MNTEMAVHYNLQATPMKWLEPRAVLPPHTLGLTSGYVWYWYTWGPNTRVVRKTAPNTGGVYHITTLKNVIAPFKKKDREITIAIAECQYLFPT